MIQLQQWQSTSTQRSRPASRNGELRIYADVPIENEEPFEAVGMWDHGEPDDLARDAARRILTERLVPVSQVLHHAATQADDNVEYVHELRNSTRRATAAIDVFRKLMSKTVRSKFRSQLREVRHAAGDARNLDVSIERYSDETCTPEVSGLCDRDELIRIIRNMRCQVQDRIWQMHRNLKRTEFMGACLCLARSVSETTRIPEELSFKDVSIVRFEKGVRFLFEATFDTGNLRQLHKTRIKCKQLLHLMEIVFRSFDTTFRYDLYPRLSVLKRELGYICNRVAGVAMFEELADRQCSSLLQKLAEFERESLHRAIADFHEEWPQSLIQDLRSDVLSHLQDRRRAA